MELREHLVSNKQLALILHWVDYCRENQIGYRFTGGLAGNFYGSQWKLQDIDIEVHLLDLFQIAQDFASYVTLPLHRYQDEEFELWLLTLTIEGQVIEINAVEDVLVKGIPFSSILENHHTVTLFQTPIRVQLLDEIIAYKTLLNRRKEVQELLSLKVNLSPS